MNAAAFPTQQLGIETLTPKTNPLLDYLENINRSSRPEVFYEKGVVRNFAKLTGKHLCQSLFLNTVQPATLLKRRLWHRCFPVNFAKFLRTPFSQNTSESCFWINTEEQALKRTNLFTMNDHKFTKIGKTYQETFILGILNKRCLSMYIYTLSYT